MIAALFLGIQVGVVALIANAVHRIAEHVLVDRAAWFVAIASAAASMVGFRFWLILPAVGFFYVLWSGGRRLLSLVVLGAFAAFAFWETSSAAVSGAHQSSAIVPGMVTTAALFVSGLKAGLLTFGGAYTAIPFVREDAVGRGWATDRQFLDSIALSGVVPAPLIMFATFVGYVAGGLGGALVITAGIFLPAFAFALLFYDRLETIIENERLHKLLEGVAAGVVGLITVTAVELGRNVAQSMALPGAATIFIASLALLYLWRSKLGMLAVVAGSAIGGLFLFS